MAIINPEGFFNGDRLRRCSNAAQLHWPRLFLASDGFARFEINYPRIIGRAYATFNPIPAERELLAFIREYAENFLLFLYQVGGQTWGQWDTQSEFLPRYKTAQDRRSPIPPEPAFTEWKRSYRQETKSFPKCFEELTKVCETFPCGVGVGGVVGVVKTYVQLTLHVLLLCLFRSMNQRPKLLGRIRFLRLIQRRKKPRGWTMA